MFEDIIDMIDYKVLGISLVFSIFIVFMIWYLPIWKDYPFINKVLMTIILPIVTYFVVLFQINR